MSSRKRHACRLAGIPIDLGRPSCDGTPNRRRGAATFTGGCDASKNLYTESTEGEGSAVLVTTRMAVGLYRLNEALLWNAKKEGLRSRYENH